MVNKTIPDLPAGSAIAGTEPVESVQGGSSVRFSIQEIADFASDLQGDIITGTSYVLVLTDNKKYKRFTAVSAIGVQIPTNASVPFPQWAVVFFEQGGTGAITFTAAGGVTLLSNGALLHSNGSFSQQSLTQVAIDTWVLGGSRA